MSTGVKRIKRKIYQAIKRYHQSVRNNELVRFRKHIPLLLKELELELLAATIAVKKIALAILMQAGMTRLG
jgi:hypothetical protein